MNIPIHFAFRRFGKTCLLALLGALAHELHAAEVVKAGAGSYLRGLPEGAKGPPAVIYKTDGVRGPMPSNDWWSSLAWEPLSSVMHPHPLAVKALADGLRVYYPGANITANNAAIFGFMSGGGDDLVLGHSAVGKFSEARVAGWSDWFVTAQMGENARGMRLTFGHGSPFVFAEFAGGEPVLMFTKAPEIFAGSEKDAVLGVRLGKSSYALFAPTGSTWNGIGTTRLAAKTNGKSYFSLALLPDDKSETLALFRKHAYAHVTDSQVAWNYDEKRSVVSTTFTLSTKLHEGTDAGTLFALYPHQWRAAAADLTGHAYASVRGPMKLARGREFNTTMNLPSALPSLPLTANTDRVKLRELLASDLAGQPQLTGDTYWLGKQLGKWATMLPLAEQAGDAASAAECDKRMRTALENFLTATTATGAAKSKGEGVFAYEPNWGTLIGYPASFGSDNELNDHHFHYGYFLRAAGEIARRDPAWAAKWSEMLRLLARDVASPDRADTLFPFLRCFDPYAGHSWASGHAKFADGNNNESSSEAVNAWFGLLLLGEATGDKPLRDLGAWLFATEIAAIEDYWFDVRDELHHPDYPASVVTMVWGGKGANGTWFSADPEAVHGINFLPVTGGSLYLGRWPDYARKNYHALLKENLEADMKAAAKKGQRAPTHGGADFDQWGDILWMYRALTDPADAQRLWDARVANFKPEAGNSLAQTYAWITALRDLGEVDRTVTADTPFAAVCTKAGKRTHVAWNLGNTPRTVTFSDGVKLQCPPRAGSSR
ncbi:MAG: glycoside hydrolase family 81 [Pedosphaera sp.]|nr:glycoside hydrolase family 81 [Pedosphaera sp.]